MEANEATTPESKSVSFPPVLWRTVEQSADTLNLTTSALIRRLAIGWIVSNVAIAVADPDEDRYDVFDATGDDWNGRPCLLTLRLSDFEQVRLQREIFRFGGKV